MDIKVAKENMIKQQLRTWNVLDEKVLNAMQIVPRENFVPEEFKKIAYSDSRIPLPNGYFMHTPKVVGRICQALELKPSYNVLEIGTGSGYTTAILAKLSHQVFSIDIDANVTKVVGEKLHDMRIFNVRLECGNAFDSISDRDIFDAVVVNGAIPNVSEKLKRQLNIKGKLFLFTGKEQLKKATVIERVSEEHWQEMILFETIETPLMPSEKEDDDIFSVNNFLNS